jgi:hypothetical protein
MKCEDIARALAAPGRPLHIVEVVVVSRIVGADIVNERK